MRSRLRCSGASAAVDNRRQAKRRAEVRKRSGGSAWSRRKNEMVEQRPADRRHHVVIEHFVEIDKPWNPGAVLGECEGNGAPDAAFADDALSQASQLVDFAPRNPWGSAPLNRLLRLDFSPVHPV